MKLATGLYEALITQDSAVSLAALKELVAESGELTAETAPHVLAQHLYILIEKAMRSAPSDDKLETQLRLAGQLVEHLSEATWNTGVDSTDAASEPARLLLSLRDKVDDRLGTGEVWPSSLSLAPRPKADANCLGTRDPDAAGVLSAGEGRGGLGSANNDTASIVAIAQPASAHT